MAIEEKIVEIKIIVGGDSGNHEEICTKNKVVHIGLSPDGEKVLVSGENEASCGEIIETVKEGSGYLSIAEVKARIEELKEIPFYIGPKEKVDVRVGLSPKGKKLPVFIASNIEPKQIERVVEIVKVEEITPRVSDSVIEKLIDECGKKIVAEGIATSQKFNEVRLFLNEQRIVTPELQLQIFELWTFYPEDRKAAIPNPKVLYQGPDTIFQALRNIVIGKANIILVGEKATGKGVLTETLCWILNIPKNCGTAAGCDGEAKYIGQYGYSKAANNGDGGIEYLLGLATASAKRNECLVIDEANAMIEELQLMMNGLFDDSKTFQDESCGVIKAGPNFFSIFTMNPEKSDDYAGVRRIQSSTDDRFITMEIKPTLMIAETLKQRVPNASDKDIAKATEIYKAIYASVVSGKEDALSWQAISMRMFVYTLRILAGLKHSIAEQEELYLQVVGTKVYQEDERGVVEQIIKACFDNESINYKFSA